MVGAKIICMGTSWGGESEPPEAFQYSNIFGAGYGDLVPGEDTGEVRPDSPIPVIPENHLVHIPNE